MSAAVRVGWVGRWPPLAPRAVAARGGPAAGRLAARLADLEGERFARLTAVAGEELLVVLGAGDDLPWAEGVVYLGRSSTAPALFLPTTRRATVPDGLLEAALCRHHASAGTPLAVLPPAAGGEAPLVVPLAGARPLDPGHLAAWRRRAPLRDAAPFRP